MIVAQVKALIAEKGAYDVEQAYLDVILLGLLIVMVLVSGDGCQQYV